MHARESIVKIAAIYRSNRIELPEVAGVYAFWWIGERSHLLGANRHIKLKGPGQRLVDVEYKDWWPEELVYPCLYVGKTTNLKNRFSLHIKGGSRQRLHDIPLNNQKQKPNTTSCQLRYGIEHVFKTEANPLKLIMEKVGFSYTTAFPYNAIAERFFEEDRLIGYWRPWFNIDSER